MNIANIEKTSIKALIQLKTNINDQVLLDHEGDFILSAILVSWRLSWNTGGNLDIPKEAASSLCTMTSAGEKSFASQYCAQLTKQTYYYNMAYLPAYLLIGDVKWVYKGAASP